MTQLRPMRDDEFPDFRREGEAAYALDLERNGDMAADAAKKKAADDWERLLAQGRRSPGQSVYVVENDGERVGVLWLAERESGGRSTIFIYDVHVDEGHRGKGLGRAAMLLAEEEARRRGISRIELNVFGGNEVARNLYRSLGYREQAIFMGKDL
jgi:ribosomal protein S18 acetylase RimI-like enzyme